MYIHSKTLLFWLNIIFIFLIICSFIGYATDYISEGSSKLYILGLIFIWLVLRELVKQDD